ncbi:MAG: hypothetical protein WAN20_18060 [Pseudonocardiaceae bacterium]
MARTRERRGKYAPQHPGGPPRLRGERTDPGLLDVALLGSRTVDFVLDLTSPTAHIATVTVSFVGQP